ncbi:MAG: glucose-6-phosphate isomerase [Candidatus Electrothrix aestuarii]|uniref:Glucose-6-phosphate isomerase n=1 Tax=Candidatus Electrothrix aestuarii TaxID=3062594 RepID=A0AAU8LYD2_9BACT|nr:glucose-6-phosphate isomerase [Candidatus Electrothrix aestuarii]
MDFLKNFAEMKATKKLEQLARTPYDLRAPQALSPDRLAGYRLSACGFDLLYGTQRVDEQVLEALQELADEARLVEQFRAMKSGAVMNRIIGHESEERQVLHTACRDLFREQPLAPEATGEARQQLDRLKAFLDDLDQGTICNSQGEPFSTMVQVGIGGSDLGPRALYLALQRSCQPGRKACFIANVDPDDAAAVLSGLDLSRTLINVVSKSGTTLETLTNEELVRSALTAAGLDPARHMVAVTGAGSPMDDPERYLTAFHMYDYIGGRYSATSMVGGVTLAFALGYDNFVEILRGAHAADLAGEQENIRENLPLLMALLGIWNRNFLGCNTVAVLPYSQALLRFPAHLQQCDMESNGKRINRLGEPVQWQTGPIVWGEPGTNGQHAFYQLLHQGTEVVPAEFIGFRESQYQTDITIKGTTSQQKLLANMLAQSLALALGKDHENPNKSFPGNRPSSVLLADRLTPYSMGTLLALYENKIAFQGFCWNINSFDQEGVQLGKILANRILAEMTEVKTGEQLPLDAPELSLLQAASLAT